MLKIRRSHDRLIFNMGIPIPAKDGLYIETGPCIPCNPWPCSTGNVGLSRLPLMFGHGYVTTYISFLWVWLRIQSLEAMFIHHISVRKICKNLGQLLKIIPCINMWIEFYCNYEVVVGVPLQLPPTFTLPVLSLRQYSLENPQGGTAGGGSLFSGPQYIPSMRYVAVCELNVMVNAVINHMHGLFVKGIGHNVWHAFCIRDVLYMNI